MRVEVELREGNVVAGKTGGTGKAVVLPDLPVLRVLCSTHVPRGLTQWVHKFLGTPCHQLRMPWRLTDAST